MNVYLFTVVKMVLNLLMVTLKIKFRAYVEATCEKADGEVQVSKGNELRNNL